MAKSRREHYSIARTPPCSVEQRLVKILRAAIAGRYRKAVSFVLIASEQGRVNPALATMDGDQERETQIYDSSLHGVGPSSDRVSARKARSRYDSRDSTRHQAPR